MYLLELLRAEGLQGMPEDRCTLCLRDQQRLIFECTAALSLRDQQRLIFELENDRATSRQLDDRRRTLPPRPVKSHLPVRRALSLRDQQRLILELEDDRATSRQLEDRRPLSLTTSSASSFSSSLKEFYLRGPHNNYSQTWQVHLWEEGNNRYVENGYGYNKINQEMVLDYV